MDVIYKLIDICKNIFRHNITVVIIFFAIIIAFYFLSSIFARFFVKILKRDECRKENIKRDGTYIAFRSFVRILGLYLAILVLDIPDDTMKVIRKIFDCILILVGANIVSSFVDIDSKIFGFFSSKSQIKGNKALVKFISKILKSIIFIIAMFMIISELGYNLNGLIAGLGIGGAVLALAAQDIFKSIIGSIVILMDRPFIIGDYIETGEYKGTVEDITFRSTRIRTLDNSVAIIQNSKMAEASIINWNKLNGSRRVKINLGITLDTPPKKMMHFMYTLKKELEEHPNVKEKSVEIHFDEIKEDQYDILIYLYVKAKNYVEFLNNQDSVNFKVVSVVEKEKINLAYPTSTVIIDKN